MSDCIFCKIVEGLIPSQIVYRDQDVVIFQDIKPLAPVHLLIIPTKHIPSLAAVQPEDQALLGKMLLLAKQMAAEAGLAESGYRLLTNSGPDSGQEVDHLHFHLIGGHFLGRFTDPSLTNDEK